MSAIVALVGRPNVGKSTLFNRLCVSKKAIVHDRPGVTRDRKYGKARLATLDFTVVDTPGLEEAEKAAIEERMMGQTFAAVASADVVCLVVDGRDGLTPLDKFFADIIRRRHSNILLVVNKCEKTNMSNHEYYKLGFGEPVYISAEHGIGMADLCESLLGILPKEHEFPEDPFKADTMQIAVVGKPNSGKSTFINALLGEQRMLTGAEAGITRDSVEIEWEYRDKIIKLVDTAGIRRKSQITDNLEKLSVGETLHTIRFANIVILMIDATIGITHQDLSIANIIIDEGRSLVLVVNKWDLIQDKKGYLDEMNYEINKNLSQLGVVPIITISAIHNKNTSSVMEECIKVYEIWNKKITTGKLNKWLEAATEEHQLPLKKNGYRIKIKYGAQISIRPPSFKFFSNNPNDISESYKKYLLNSLRNKFNMNGVPIRMYFTATTNPYAKKSNYKR